MAISFRSKPVFVVDLPEIEDLSVVFKYHYFTTGEAVYNATEDKTLDGRDLSRYGFPRVVIIDLKNDTLNNLALGDQISTGLSTSQIQQILSAENFSKATTESQMQSMPSTRLAFMSKAELEDTIANDFNTDDATDNYSSFSTLVGNVNEEVKKLLSDAVARDSGASGAIIFDSTTNLPVVEYDESRNLYETNSTVFNFAVGDIVKSIANNFLSGESANYVEKVPEAVAIQENLRKSQRSNSFNFDDYEMQIDPINYNKTSYVTGIGLLGIIAFKTRVDGDNRIPEKPIVLLERDKNQITDNAVMYGATYDYSLHTLGLCSLRDNTNKITDFLVVSPGGRKVTIDCIEAKPPKTVTSVNFRFMDSSMQVEWDLPSQTSATGQPLNDIKYVQVFERNSVYEPFRLFMMLDFNDSLVRIPLQENIPLSRTVFVTRSQNFVEVPLPTRAESKIWAVCTVDAHGNSSNLSGQYRSTVDSLNNYSMEHVAYPGSPKQYPNLTCVEDGFVDSIKAAGCSKLEIYHNPTITTLIGTKEEKMIEVSKTNGSSGEYLPAYVLQLIDIETQEDQIINFYIKEK